jgi:hypothetical protein
MDLPVACAVLPLKRGQAFSTSHLATPEVSCKVLFPPSGGKGS